MTTRASEERAQGHALEALHHLVDALAAATSLNEIYREAIRGLLPALRVDRASILLFDEDGVMRFKAWHGLSDAYRAAVEGHSPWEPGTIDPPVIVIEDVREAPELAALQETIAGEGIRSLAFVPLHRQRLLGKFMLYGDQPRRFEEHELRLAETIAALVAFAIERRRDEQRLGQQAAALARSNEELQRFAYASSHDLKEPLRTIAAFVQLLQQRHSGRLGGDSEEFLAFIVDGVRRMEALIESLMAYARVDWDAPVAAHVELSAALAEARANLKAALDDSGAVLEVGELPAVEGEFRQLVLLFQNLLSNAIKFRRVTPPHVAFSAERIAEGWRISVSDDGIGIPSDQRERAFEPFRRLHSREQYPGTGLGLAICKKIVLRHGGTIGVTSAVGRGSTFTFTLPSA
jgi:signal transduction histidine kinase